MNRLTLAVVLLVLVAGPGLAQERAHVHGQGNLDITAEAGTLMLHLKTPVHNLLGFERKPRSASERAAVEGMVARLKAADSLYVPTPAAECRLTSVEVDSPLFGGAAGDVHQHGQVDHEDLISEAKFQCRHPERLRNLKVGLFAAFGGLRRIDVQIVSARGQSAARLSSAKSTVDW